MNYPLLKILTSLAEEGNDSAYVLLTKWNGFISGDLDKSELSSALAIAGSIPRSSDLPKELPPRLHDCDLRIESLEVSGFRGIPHASEDGYLYGISMLHAQREEETDVESHSQSPRSIVVLGSNGSGKTSVYSSMEYLWKNTTAIARKHKYISSENEFYRNHSDQTKDFRISCHIVGDKVFNFNRDSKYNISQCIDLKNFFCSESDISIIECEGMSIINFFNEEIGIKELMDLRKFIEENLNSQKGYLEELKSDIEDVSEDNKEENGIVENTSEDIADKSEGKKEILRKNISELSAVIEAIDGEVKEIRKIFYPRAQKILVTLLKDYDDGIVRPGFQTEDEEILFDGRLEYIEKKIEIDPRTYFNNFRFKLYLVSIRIAIAFSIMKSQNICFPLVFDDIFDSSDFNNRLKAEPFFRNIVRLYHDLEIHSSPLQIIFFTQDEVIAECVFKGITKDIYPDDDPNCRIVTNDAVYCRLFNPAEIKKEDIVKFRDVKVSRSSDCSVLSEEESRVGIATETLVYSFNNLYDVIKTSLAEFRH